MNVQNINGAAGMPAAYSMKGERKYIDAPDSLPKYSINKAAAERDEFYKSVRTAYRQAEQAKAKTGRIKKMAGILAAAAAFIILDAKKII